ncbi:hypothetical protein M1D96_05835 [Pseudomonas sp. D1-3]
MPSPSAQTISVRLRMLSLLDRLADAWPATSAAGHGLIVNRVNDSGLPQCADTLLAKIHSNLVAQ